MFTMEARLSISQGKCDALRAQHWLGPDEKIEHPGTRVTYRQPESNHGFTTWEPYTQLAAFLFPAWLFNFTGQ